MATSAIDARKQVRCRYFLHGACKLKSDCPFSHNINDKPSMICTFYLKGSCSYGKQCRYDHVKPDYKEKEKTDKSLSTSSKTVRVHVPAQLPTMAKDTDKKLSTMADKWNVNAPEFFPAVSYVSEADTDADLLNNDLLDALTAEEISELMCPFAAVRECPYGKDCYYIHGLRCDICELECLNPLDPEQQAEHRKSCLTSHEQNMEYSFAIQRSEGVVCSICLDVVTERETVGERRFGILENCNHPFCLSCIRKWRQSSEKSKVVKACPICRVNSGFVTPSEVWIDSPVEKSKLIADYHDALSSKDCRYFDRGNGLCPFGTSCFYKHAYADGKLESREKPKLRFCEDSDGNARSVRSQRLWDFIEERDMRGNEDW